MNRKELFYLSIGIFLTVIAWVIADIKFLESQKILEKRIESPMVVDYSIDKEILKTLEKKRD
ncbi:MAG: hypothetical protein NZL96_00580 [Patescibacteria group bacterium]|nr:hypothetical protein [Patescibacteria group bacterium]